MKCSKEDIEQVLEFLSQIQQDQSIPKNVRIKLKIVFETLSIENKDISLRIDQTLQEMDEISENPNIPIYAKTQLWSVVSLLEELRQ